MKSEREYIVQVTEEKVRTRMFRYHIEIIDPNIESVHVPIPSREEMGRVIKHAWCGYKFMIDRTVNRAIKEIIDERDEGVIRRFRVKVENV